MRRVIDKLLSALFGAAVAVALFAQSVRASGRAPGYSKFTAAPLSPERKPTGFLGNYCYVRSADRDAGAHPSGKGKSPNKSIPASREEQHTFKTLTTSFHIAGLPAVSSFA